MSPGCFVPVKCFRLAGALAILFSSTTRGGAQSTTFAGTAQHTSQYSSQAQHLNRCVGALDRFEEYRSARALWRTSDYPIQYGDHFCAHGFKRFRNQG
jgi:hypothetical protein